MKDTDAKETRNNVRIGCAGWSIPRAQADAFPAGASHLERYARVLPAVEINTSFYRPHRPATYRRWAASVPPGFQFAVKMPQAITHERRLRDSEALLDTFLSECRELGATLGPLLLQLPPSLVFDSALAAGFLGALRARHDGPLACEPRHPSWFTGEAAALLVSFQAARVAADPAVVAAAASPGGWNGLSYYRLHGSPRVYYSAYEDAMLDTLAGALRRAGSTGAVWCIFDNTASGAASVNALELLRRLGN